ncbi:hypothetical protein NMY22_g3136 [Coprinellus aureogranulatus]|nr:hypothetical protein NMY22_g3136 [Coprinellus aureogranulatus]
MSTSLPRIPPESALLTSSSPDERHGLALQGAVDNATERSLETIPEGTFSLCYRLRHWPSTTFSRLRPASSSPQFRYLHPLSHTTTYSLRTLPAIPSSRSCGLFRILYLLHLMLSRPPSLGFAAA